VISVSSHICANFLVLFYPVAFDMFVFMVDVFLSYIYRLGINEK